MRIETIAVHAGHQVDPTTAAVTPPIHLSTTFAREPDGSYRQGLSYARETNPNRASLEQCLTALEGGAAAAAFSSGSGATMAVFQALSPGDHVAVAGDSYYGTRKLLRELFTRWGLEVTAVDMTDLGAVQRALRPSTRIVWAETPSNPLVRVSDIPALAELAHGAGARLVVDNTWATPVLTRPLELGAELVMHSTTKYLGGHSDVLGGALVTAAEDDLWSRIVLVQRAGGVVPSPFECWLTLRGIRTLPWRVRAQSANALALARFLDRHKAVEAVHYPGLKSHVGHDVASRQMSAFGGMLSIQVRGGRSEAMALAGRLELVTRATSLGGTETLIEHRASVEGPETQTPENLLRISVGLEAVEDLMEDFEQALG